MAPLPPPGSATDDQQSRDGGKCNCSGHVFKCAAPSGGSRISWTGEGTNPQGGRTNLLFGQLFPENCMKMK